MADTAAHLVDRVLPKAPVRQWVLSLPFTLRYRLAYDARLARDVLSIFVRVVFSSLRRRARDRNGIWGAQCGAVTFVQRFGDALNLNVHFHTLVLDGVYTSDSQQRIRFQVLPPPDNAEVAGVTDRIARRVVRLLERRGLALDRDPDEADPLRRDQPLLAELYGASVHSRIANGPRAGHRVTTLGNAMETPAVMASARCASVSGFSVHANVCIPARARRQLEKLCRYAARPPVATERLSRLSDGRLLYGLRHRWRDGTTHVIFEPIELVEKLAALVPPPRFNLVRYHGVLAPRARWRRNVVPQ
jgi:Putative transposase